MKLNLLTTITLLSLSMVSCSQGRKYNEVDFMEYKIELANASPFKVYYKHKTDTSFQMVKKFFDSTRKNIVSKEFFYKGLLHGPYETYIMDGSIFQKGEFEMGKRNGKEQTFKSGIISSEKEYKNGVKVGSWIKYDSNGRIVEKITFDENGNILQEQ